MERLEIESHSFKGGGESIVSPSSAKAQAEKVASSKGSVFSLLDTVAKYLGDPRVRKEAAHFLNQLGLAISMIKDYFNGNYKQLPFQTLVGLIAAAVYFVAPIDAIPDVIPGLGFLDDAGVIALVLASFNDDVTMYREWAEGGDN
ncbi:YkvA family protein [uncultured Mesotoga sp.]|uniref:YkvA family protein n=1 Tax=uncultured Mesotoga sp. TaxID=1184400 RepID=UPI0025973E4B|nr:YkvA family protein [uncultured Mesotoga sp.]